MVIQDVEWDVQMICGNVTFSAYFELLGLFWVKIFLRREIVV